MNPTQVSPAATCASLLSGFSIWSAGGEEEEELVLQLGHINRS